MYKKILICAVIILFVGASVIPSISSNDKMTNEDVHLESVYLVDDGWNYCKEITINSVKVDDDLENFPVLIHHTSSDLTTHAQSDGDDFFFITVEGTKLNHEIEQYDKNTGELIAWVKIPNLSSTTNTKLYMYYGNPNCDSQQSPEKVWDSNYIAVYHMDDITDGTGNGNTLGEHGGISKTNDGKIGSCYSFDGYNDYLADIWTPPSKITVEAWFYADIKEEDACRDIVCIRNDASHGNAVLEKRHVTDNYELWFTGGYPDWEKAKYADWSAQTWLYAAGTAEKNAYTKMYLNGLHSASSTNARTNDLDTISGTEFCIGQRGGPLPHGQDRRWDGRIDEVRISNIVRSAEWILTSYNNQNDPDSFMTIGDETPIRIAFLFGKITALNTAEDYITFDAVKLRVIHFMPFSFNTYISGEKVIVFGMPMGVLDINRAFGFFKVSI
jgi:concanavalin A-like lectin/glucanase superfamily protein/uncharacterized protein DUF2341